jgi:3-dehydroquinate synthetase
MNLLLSPRKQFQNHGRAVKFGLMTAAKVIQELDSLPPDEQAKVIQHAFELARHRELSADELGDLAERLASSNDPAEIIRLKSAMTRGFYGE